MNIFRKIIQFLTNRKSIHFQVIYTEGSRHDCQMEELIIFLDEIASTTNVCRKVNERDIASPYSWHISSDKIIIIWGTESSIEISKRYQKPVFSVHRKKLISLKIGDRWGGIGAFKSKKNSSHYRRVTQNLDIQSTNIERKGGLGSSIWY